MPEIKCVFYPRKICPTNCGNHEEIADSIRKAAEVTNVSEEEIVKNTKWERQEKMLRLIRPEMTERCTHGK